MKGGPAIFFWMPDHIRPFRVEIDIKHHLKVIEVGMDDWRFESIHDDLTSALGSLIDDSGKQGIYYPQ